MAFRNFGEALPAGGFSGLFDVTELPAELKVSYWIWVIGGLLGLLGGAIGGTGAPLMDARRRFRATPPISKAENPLPAAFPQVGPPLEYLS